MIVGVLVLCLVAFVLFQIAVYWIVYEKAGEPGWACLIPVYNYYVLLRIAGRSGWWLLVFMLAFILAGINKISPVPVDAGGGLSSVIQQGILAASLLLSFFSYIFFIVINLDIAKRFNKGIFFGLGMWLLPLIFYPILAFGRAVYMDIDDNDWEQDDGDDDDGVYEGEYRRFTRREPYKGHHSWRSS